MNVVQSRHPETQLSTGAEQNWFALMTDLEWAAFIFTAKIWLKLQALFSDGLL